MGLSPSVTDEEHVGKSTVSMKPKTSESKLQASATDVEVQPKPQPHNRKTMTYLEAAKAAITKRDRVRT